MGDDEQEQRVEPDKVVGFEGEANEVAYTKRDLLLYALGIGYETGRIDGRAAPAAAGLWIDGYGSIGLTYSSTPPTHRAGSCKNTEAELPFLYEDHDRFAAFPTFPLVLPFKGTSHDVVPFPSPTLFSFPPGGSVSQSDPVSQPVTRVCPCMGGRGSCTAASLVSASVSLFRTTSSRCTHFHTPHPDTQASPW